MQKCDDCRLRAGTIERTNSGKANQQGLEVARSFRPPGSTIKVPVHEALLAELFLSEICQGPIRDCGRNDVSADEQTGSQSAKPDYASILPLSVGTVASRGMDRSSTF